MYVVFADHAKRFGVDAAVASFSGELPGERVESFRQQYLEDKAKIRSGGPPIITAGRDDWYSGPDDNSRYWRALADELTSQGWPEDRLESLDRSSNVVVAHTPQPSRPARWDAKGLVVGYVQSGKTGSGSAALAFLVGLGINGGVTYQVRNRAAPAPSGPVTGPAPVPAVSS